ARRPPSATARHRRRASDGVRQHAPAHCYGGRGARLGDPHADVTPGRSVRSIEDRAPTLAHRTFDARDRGREQEGGARQHAHAPRRCSRDVDPQFLPRRGAGANAVAQGADGRAPIAWIASGAARCAGFYIWRVLTGVSTRTYAVDASIPASDAGGYAFAR